MMAGYNGWADQREEERESIDTTFWARSMKAPDLWRTRQEGSRGNICGNKTDQLQRTPASHVKS